MREIDDIAVIGAGVMGCGIARVAAAAGLRVRLYDVSSEALDAGITRLRASLGRAVEQGKMAPVDRDTIVRRLSPHDRLGEAVDGVQAVIEAAPERLDLKKEIFSELSACVGPDVLLGTNTSSLSVTEVAAAAVHPERVIGTHFFNPPHVLKLLELVRGERTAQQAVDAASALGRRLDRFLIVVNDSAGFATSRLGVALGLEAMRMVEQGVASVEDIDSAMEQGYRHPMGPLRVSDLVGLDVRLAIAEHLHQEIGEQFRPPQILRRMVRAGKLGKKTGEGFYRW